IASLPAAAMTRGVMAVPHPREPFVATCSYFHSGVAIRSFDSGADRAVVAPDESAHSIAWSPNGRLFAVSGTDNAIRLYETGSWRLIRRIAHEQFGLFIKFLDCSRHAPRDDPLAER